MILGGDVLVLYSLIESSGRPTLRSLGERLGVKHSKVQRGLDRLAGAGIYDRERGQVVPHAAEEFLLHALKYVHPVQEGAATRGIPTAWGAEPLASEIVAPEPPPVWPDPRGRVRGPSIQPIDPHLPQLVSAWPELAELAALCDALALGDARVRGSAEQHIRRRLRQST